jgi:hypothetical protein
MSLAIDIDQVTAALLIDGWHTCAKQKAPWVGPALCLHSNDLPRRGSPASMPGSPWLLPQDTPESQEVNLYLTWRLWFTLAVDHPELRSYASDDAGGKVFKTEAAVLRV